MSTGGKKMNRYPLLAMVAGSLVAACGPQGTVRVDTTLAESEALARAERGAATIGIPTATGKLVIENVRIAVSEVELEGAEEGGAEFEVGERVVAVALDGSATEIVVDSVSTGAYEELGLELMVGGIEDFGGAQPASIIVNGSHDGAAFSYRSGVAPELEFNLDKPAEVREGGTARIAVTFDVAAWFLGADGSALNPTDPANRKAIEDAILRSMAAYAEIELSDGD
jgi:hypothetical protein